MPLYDYSCHDCKKSFEARHGMFFEDQKCISCHSENVVRTPPLSHNNIIKVASVSTGTPKPGQVVDKYISDAKEEIRKEKTRLRAEEK